MKANPLFAKQDQAFWASVRSLSQDVGYTTRGEDRIKAASLVEMRDAFTHLGLNPLAVADKQGRTTELGYLLLSYFRYQADVLDNHVSKVLMNAEEAKALFELYRKEFQPTCPLPLNKQKGDKKSYAFLTGLVNMMVEKHLQGLQCDYDPRKLTTITRNGVPLRTLARRVDGAFPNSINPVAIWEVKEYYYTTTFGSRIADGVYESLLDGMELEELRENTNVDVKHYLMVDAYQTWWVQGKAYLCRIVDMLNMGYVDEVLFGREIVGELPRIVHEWKALLRTRSGV